ncbi:hypothetical protein QZH41_020048, partial [Actinostola sp. cb2023]
MKKHVSKNTKTRMTELDKNHDNKVTWDEYVKEEYKHSDGKNHKVLDLCDEAEKKSQAENKAREEKRFKIADSDGDNALNAEELAIFIHPEESARMTSLLVEENIEALDKDGDGLINFEEYAGLGEPGAADDKETMDSLKENFNNDLDKNKDGKLDREEVKDWIIPGGDADPATGETDHLMREADMN